MRSGCPPSNTKTFYTLPIMKKLILLVLPLVLIARQSSAQNKETLSVNAFDKVVISPRINVVFVKGEKESVELIYSNIDASMINVKVKHNKLHLYLYKSKWFERKEKYYVGECDFKRDAYPTASVTAYVTYRDLKKLVVRGEEEVNIYDTLHTDKLKLKMYGEAELRIAALATDKLTAKLYGENVLKINGGHIKEQNFKLYGENKIDTRAIESRTIASVIYGEGQLRVKASDWMSLRAFGEPQIQLSGNAHLFKGLVIGNPRIQTRQ